MSDVPRYSTRALPPYTYVPGSGTPHPISNPRGHMHGQTESISPALDPQHWQENATYLYAVDLFNHGYYWEAHEAWESLWHAAGHHGQVADFLKGLIKLAAAGVKQLEQNLAGVNRHLSRATELLTRVGETNFCGVDLAAIIAQASQCQLPTRISLAPLLP
jgi:predicted metal-dependent hydrolase